MRGKSSRCNSDTDPPSLFLDATKGLLGTRLTEKSSSQVVMICAVQNLIPTNNFLTSNNALIGSLNLRYQPLYLCFTLYGEWVRQVSLSWRFLADKGKLSRKKRVEGNKFNMIDFYLKNTINNRQCHPRDYKNSHNVKIKSTI